MQPRVIVIDKNFLNKSSSENISTYVSKLNSTEMNEMLSLKCLNLNNTYYIAVGLYGGFKLWSIDGIRLIFQIPNKNKNPNKPYAITAISEYNSTSTNLGYDSILCGDNNGQLFIVLGSGTNWKAKPLYCNDDIACTALCSSIISEHVCVGYETGEVYILKMKSENFIEISVKLDSLTNLPCLSMAILQTDKTILAIGYLNGEVKLHDLSSGKFDLICSIGAHLRSINNLISYKNYLITCGDDSFVNVWKIDNNFNVVIAYNIELNDKMPVGMALLEKEGKLDLLVSCYDCTSIAIIENLNI
jgi:WD40 repeat protein